MDFKRETGRIAGAPTNGTAQEMTNEALLECDCDVLAPGALEDQIRKENASAVKARVLLELANGPTTPAADAILVANGVQILPDILANAGGVIVSYFEWTQNRAGYYWTLDDVHARLRMFIESATDDTWGLHQRKGIDLRIAAYVLALQRISEAIQARGTRAYFRT